jgi:predicted GNAT family N-acyltransferase
MELVDLGPLSAAQQAELVGEEIDPWGTLGKELEWRPKDAYVALLSAEGRVVAAAGWLIAEVEIADRSLPVVGIGGVIVAARLRGQGLGRCVITEALGRAVRLGPEIALLFCQPDRVGLYQRHGFARVTEPVQVEQTTGIVDMPMETMWRALGPEGALPAGPIKVPGLPF